MSSGPTLELDPALVELRLVLDEGVALQARAEAVLRDCLDPGVAKDAVFARRAGAVASAYARLVGRTEQLRPSPLVEAGHQLLLYHVRLLEATTRYVFNTPPGVRRRLDVKFSTRLGDPAARLRRLRDLLG